VLCFSYTHPFALETLGAGTERKQTSCNSTKFNDKKGEDNTWAWKTIESHTMKAAWALMK